MNSSVRSGIADSTKRDVGNWDHFTLTPSESWEVTTIGETMMMRPPSATRFYLYEVIAFNDREARFEIRPSWEHEVI